MSRAILTSGKLVKKGFSNSLGNTEIKQFSPMSHTNSDLSSFMNYTMAMNFLNFKVNKALTVTVEKSNAKSFNINSGSSSIPHYKKKATGGEDSFLVCEDLLMVADGVGGWAGKGIDPGEYSRELRDHIKEEYEKRKNFNLDENEVKSSLVEAVKRTKSTGSSTCVLLLLNQETKKLHATYVGDSLYMILRFNDNKSKFEVVHKSNEQQHRFNQPFQVGTNGDNPSLAVMESHDVQDKDLVITASDGLWDNLFDEMILELVNTQTLKEEKKIKDCNELAGRLAVEAEKYSLDVNYESPFAKRARAKGIEYYGGKEDDITVIVTQIDQIQETMTLNNNEENHIL